MVVMRPNTAMGTYGPNVEIVDTETKLCDEFTLAPGFRKELESFYSKASPEDQARCLELLSSIQISKDLRAKHKSETQDQYHKPKPPKPEGERFVPVSRRQRPKTAMANLDRPSQYINSEDQDFGPYSTTYGREYKGNYVDPALAERPASTRRMYQASYKLQSPVGSSTYQNEYYNKPPPKQGPTLDRDQRNNPHPLKTFMVWRLPHKAKKEKPYSEWSTELTDDIMDQVCRGKVASTYQMDYLGIPQGFQVKGAFKNTEDWKAKIPYSLDSSMRHNYRGVKPQREIKGNNTRYGCNLKKSEPAIGCVPTVSKRQMHLKNRTTYDREYVEPGAERKPREVRDLGRQAGAQTLTRYYENADEDEKDNVCRMMKAMDIRPPSNRPPSSASIRNSMKFRPVVPPTTCVDSPSPNYIAGITPFTTKDIGLTSAV